MEFVLCACLSGAQLVIILRQWTSLNGIVGAQIARTDVQPAQLLKRSEQGMPPSALYDGQLRRL